jgi:hypothetical protein
MIRHLTPDELLVGMTVAMPVRDRDGRTMCAAGAVLTERVLGRLRAMGLERVAVVVESPAAREEAAQQIRHRFRRALDDPAMEGLCELFTRACLRVPDADSARLSAAPEASADMTARLDEWQQPGPLARFVRACLPGRPQAMKAAG